MSEIRVGAVLEPALKGTIAIVGGTASGLARLHPALNRFAVWSHQAATFVSIFLTPSAVLALSLGLWRLSADLGLTGNFPIADGLFSHWIVWIGLAVLLKMTESMLIRRNTRPSAAVSEPK